MCARARIRARALAHACACMRVLHAYRSARVRVSRGTERREQEGTSRRRWPSHSIGLSGASAHISASPAKPFFSVPVQFYGTIKTAGHSSRATRWRLAAPSARRGICKWAAPCFSGAPTLARSLLLMAAAPCAFGRAIHKCASTRIGAWAEQLRPVVPPGEQPTGRRSPRLPQRGHRRHPRRLHRRDSMQPPRRSCMVLELPGHAAAHRPRRPSEAIFGSSPAPRAWYASKTRRSC